MLLNFILLLLVCWSSETVGNVLDSTAEWKDKAADIYFLLDSSSSVYIQDYGRMRNFVADLVSDMDIRPQATRVGLGVFSQHHNLYIPINNQYPKDSLIQRIRNTPYIQGDTYISRALEGMRKEGLSPYVTRPGVPLITVLLTDGKSRKKQQTYDNATIAKKDKIFIFCVGIGNDVDKNELRTTASDPKEDYLFYVNDFYQLSDIRKQLSSNMAKVEFLQGDKGACGENTVSDTVFVYDEYSLGEKNTKKVKEFIKAVAQNFSMNSGNARIAIFSKTCHQGEITLGQFVTKEGFTAAIDNDNDGPDISQLIFKARSRAFRVEFGARDYALRRIVLILHAPVNQLNVRREALYASHLSDAKIFVIRLGTDYDKSFLNSIASSVTFYDSADHLLRRKDIFLRSFCEGRYIFNDETCNSNTSIEGQVGVQAFGSYQNLSASHHFLIVGVGLVIALSV